MNRSASRMPAVDALKAVASQVIVLHHLASYGAMSDALFPAAPELIRWLYDYGRMAVAVFLVVGGFLAAKGLAPDGQPLPLSPLSAIWRRYLRLAIPYLAAITLAMACAAVARLSISEDFVPDAPTVSQILAHAVLLQGVLDLPSLSAGVWYIAIDFQLFALMVVVLWLARRGRRLAPVLVTALALAGLFWFGRDAEWDNWAIYFFGSYGMGALTWWASARSRSALWLGLIAAVTLVGLAVDFRFRVAVALGTALVLGVSRLTGALDGWQLRGPMGFLGRISYSVFLVHFPICLLGNAWFTHFQLGSETEGGLALLVTWGVSVVVGALFYRFVERPASTMQLEELPARLWRRLREATGADLANPTMDPRKP